jgi:hypothetical protein
MRLSSLKSSFVQARENFFESPRQRLSAYSGREYPITSYQINLKLVENALEKRIVASIEGG